MPRLCSGETTWNLGQSKSFGEGSLRCAPIQASIDQMEAWKHTNNDFLGQSVSECEPVLQYIEMRLKASAILVNQGVSKCHE